MIAHGRVVFSSDTELAFLIFFLVLTFEIFIM